MIDLRDTYVKVNTREECEKLFKIAKEQGYKWVTGEELKITDKQKFPDVISFFSSKEVFYGCRHRIYTASEILNENQSEEKEMTAREFIKCMIKCTDKCADEPCRLCTLSSYNTRCEENLCSISNWKGREEELLKLARKKLNEMTEEKAVELLQSYLDNRIYETSEEQEAIKLAIRKLRGE